MSDLGAWGVIGFVVASVFVVMKVSSKKQEVAVKLVLFMFLFLMLSGGYVFITNNVDFTSAAGLTAGTKLYWAWLSSLGSNIASVTAFTIHQDWGINSTAVLGK